MPHKRTIAMQFQAVFAFEGNASERLGWGRGGFRTFVSSLLNTTTLLESCRINTNRSQIEPARKEATDSSINQVYAKHVLESCLPAAREPA